MKKSIEIETELDSTTKRLDELTEMRDRLNNNLQTLQSGFVDGKASLDELQTEQSKLAALDSSIKVLEVKQSELHSAFQKASLSETVKTDIGNLKTIAEQADAAFTEYDGLRVKLGETIAAAVEKIISKSAEFYGKQREFRAVRNQIEAKEPGFNIAGELSRLGLPEKSYNSATTEFIHLSPCKFGECVALAERLVGQETQRRQQATEQAAFAAERAGTQAAQKAKRDEEKAILAREFEAERQRVIQFRIDNGLPALLPEFLDNAVREVQTRKADAETRGATISV
jgi:uncharacterized phage infection (PIP) family protein YhgE